MIRPGKNFIGSLMRLTINIADTDCVDFDPTGVSIKVMKPNGDTNTYTFGTDDELQKVNTGDYQCDFTLTHSGRWHYRWITTGTNPVTDEGSFVVQMSPIEDKASSDYGAYC